jgi:NAD(P)-dependent dehydrogenase (short-subunit alcohol dehydrogenase family)
MRPQAVWLITGVSSGLGRSLAEAALARGDSVIGTVRQPGKAEAFEALAPGRSKACLVDLADGARVAPAISAALENAGGVDVVVNNAGYGLAGAVEEVSEAEARHQMETNFFGLVAVTQAALPFLRGRGGGHVVNISSLAGFQGILGMALYSASKFAVEGFSEALAAEAGHLGIRVTIVEPGAFRTNWSSNAAIVRSKRVIDAYAASAGRVRAGLTKLDGRQSGDPAKAAQAILSVVDAPNPPLRLPLGADAVAALGQKLASMTKELEQWRAVAEATALQE